MQNRNNLSQSVKKNIIQVFGQGIVEVKPDLATLTIGVITENKDITDAQEENKQVINKIIEVLKSYDIQDDAIRTIRYTVQPVYDFVEGKRQFRGYEITHLLEVNVTNIEDAGRILEDAVNVGANKEINLQFKVEEREKYYQEALNRATINSQEKAKKMANVLGSAIEELPLEVKEITDQRVMPTQLELRYVDGGVPIQSGQLQISANVQATFRLK